MPLDNRPQGSTGQERANGAPVRGGARLWLCLLPAALLLPLLDKAFSVDDGLFVDDARALARLPADPFAARVFFGGADFTLGALPHPLGWASLVALARALLGESEPALHLLQVLFALLALAALASLARRFEVSPLAACWLVAGSSAFLAIGSSVLPYLAWAALSLAAFDRLVRGVEEGRTTDLLLAGIAAGGAFLCCFAGALVIAAQAAYPLFTRRHGLRCWLPLATGVAVAAGYETWSAAVHGAPHFLATLHAWSQPFGPGQLANAAADLVQLGGQLPAAWLALGAAALLSRSLAPTVAAGAVPAVLVLVLHLARPYELPWKAAGAFVAPGAALLAWGLLAGALAARRWLQRRQERGDPLRLLLALWLLGGTFFSLDYVHVAAKYMLLPLPAAVLLLLDAWRRVPRGRVRTAALGALVLAQLAVGLLVAWSDDRWAGSYRTFFAADAARWVSWRGHTFVDADWGVGLYAERASLARYHGQPLAPCDRLLFTDLVPHPFAGKAILGAAHHVARLELAYPGPLAVMEAGRAGFYSNGFALVPYRPEARVSDVVSVLEMPGKGCR